MTTLRLNAPLDDVEVQMRRALRVGTTGSGVSGREQDNRSTRRFSQTGDVPVTRLPPRKDHPAASALAAAEEALQAERLLREQAEAALVQANTALVALQTKFAHADMAYVEAIAVERALLEAARRDLAEGGTPAPKQSLESAPQLEEEPVQWWVPGWQGDYGIR